MYYVIVSIWRITLLLQVDESGLIEEEMVGWIFDISIKVPGMVSPKKVARQTLLGDITLGQDSSSEFNDWNKVRELFDPNVFN